MHKSIHVLTITVYQSLIVSWKISTKFSKLFLFKMQGVPESGTLGVFASTDQLGDQNFSKRLNAYLHVRTGHRKCGNSDA